MTKPIPRGRSISQILSRAGFTSAGIRHRTCGFVVPADAHGFGCTEVTCSWPGALRSWRGVTISWYGDTEPPFAQITELITARGYEVGEPDPRSLMTGRPSITAWFSGADLAHASE